MLGHRVAFLPAAMVTVLAIAGGCMTEPSPDDATPSSIKALIPAATAVRISTLDEIRELGAQIDTRKLPEMPLSLLILIVRVPDPGTEDLRALTFPDGHSLLEDPARMWCKVSGEHATLFPAECLSAVTVFSTADGVAGDFRFHREGLCEGRIEYSARPMGRDLRIVEFRIPGMAVRTILGDDEVWRHQ